MVEIKSLLSVVKDVFQKLKERQNNSIEALGATRKAFIYTYDYLITNQGAYKPNLQLADLWNDASVKVMKVDQNIGDMLAHKSRFWTHPDIYLELNRTSDVPTLREITDEMERIRQQI